MITEQLGISHVGAKRIDAPVPASSIILKIDAPRLTAEVRIRA